MVVRTLIAALLALAAATAPAFAASALLAETCAWLSGIVKWLVGVAYVTATIGFVFISIKASAMGKFSAGGFITILAGLFVVSTSPAILSYVMDGTFSWTCATP